MVKPLCFDPDAPALSNDSPILVELFLQESLDWIHAYGPNHAHEPGAKHIAHDDARKPRLVCPNPKPGAYYLDTRTGAYEPSRCERNTCPVCCVINSWYIAAAIKCADPDYSLTLTLVGNSWQEISNRIRKFFHHLAAFYPTIKYSYSVEPNPAGTGAHVHCFIHTAGNENVSPKAVAKSASRVGIGYEFELTRPRPDSTRSYYGYPTKLLEDPDMQSAFLEANGSRLVHTSKTGFWRNGRHGESLTFRHAKVLARHRR